MFVWACRHGHVATIDPFAFTLEMSEPRCGFFGPGFVMCNAAMDRPASETPTPEKDPMRTIFKYPLSFSGDALVVHPDALAGPVIHVGNDPQGLAQVWIEGDSSRPRIPRSFRVHGTGHEVAAGVHVGSFLDGVFVWHVYEVTT